MRLLRDTEALRNGQRNYFVSDYNTGTRLFRDTEALRNGHQNYFVSDYSTGMRLLRDIEALRNGQQNYFVSDYNTGMRLLRDTEALHNGQRKYFVSDYSTGTILLRDTEALRSHKQTKIYKFYVHVTVHRDKFFIIKPTRCINFSNLFWKEPYMFRTVPLSIIRSFFTVHTAMVYVIQVC